MTFLDLFAGIGGFRAGMELAGHKCIGFCEFDKFAVASYTSMYLITEEQRKYLATLPFNKRQKEILKEKYKNGEWYAADIRRVCTADIPGADCWCFGFPCQDISVAGKQKGFQGSRSSLFFRVMYLIGQLEEKRKPSFLFIENVRNLLGINGGWDFARLLIELDKNGYDAEWQVLNSKDFGVPQNRERIFIIGHLRGRRTVEVFPVTGTDGKNNIRQVGREKTGKRDNPNQYRVYDPSGLLPCLGTMEGGGRVPHIPAGICDLNAGEGIRITDTARCLQARYNKGITNRKGEVSGVVEVLGNTNPRGRGMSGKVYGIDGISPALTTNKGEGLKIGVPPENISIDLKAFSSTTRRGAFKEGYTGALDSNCYQGILLKLENDSIYAVWSEIYGCYIAVRKLTPRECFRLQGFEDQYHERAAFVNSDSQLYKQAGNSVTVPVIDAIAERLRYE